MRAPKAALIALGSAAGLVLLGLAPTVYDRVRCEILLGRLERGDDPEARRELADPRYAERVFRRLLETAMPSVDEKGRDPDSPGFHARLEAAGSRPVLDAEEGRRLAAPLIDLALEGRLEPRLRKGVFDVVFPLFIWDSSSSRGSQRRPGQASSAIPSGTRLIGLRASGELCQFAVTGSWAESLYPSLDASSRPQLAQYLEFFVLEESRARLVHQRSSWVLFSPSGSLGSSAPQLLETEDLTGSPDPIGFFMAPPLRKEGRGKEPVIELRLGVAGGWKQFFTGFDTIERSFSYTVELDLSLPASGLAPYLLGRVAVADDGPQERWFAESAYLGQPIADLHLGAHWVYFQVPAAEAKLQPLEKVRLIFRPDPSFAERNGFSAPEADSPSFTREYYLAPFD